MKVRDLPIAEVKEFLWFIHRLCLNYDASLTGGPRTAKRNMAISGSRGSKHTFEGGFGCAADLLLDDPKRLPALRLEVDREGYHYYRSETYADGQCHIQMLKFGQKV